MSSLAVLNTAAELAGRPEPQRDQWGRYLIPHPETGEVQAWTRATTWAQTVADTFALTNWRLRMCAVGLARRPDLLAQAATVLDPDEPDSKRLLGKVTQAAMEAAGSTVRANLGTALHSFTEHIDMGRDATVPDAYAADLAAYQRTTQGLKIDPEHVERIVVVPELGVAGTFDRLVTWDGRLLIADLKTGRDLSYSWTEIAIQLALYAHGATIWDQATAQHLPMPEVDQQTALVLHLPVGEGQCTVYSVDIGAGWDMAAVCGTVRAWRKRTDLAAQMLLPTVDLAATPEPEPPPRTLEVGAESERSAWVRRRVTQLAHHPQGRPLLAAAWPDEVPTPKNLPPHGWLSDQVDRLVAVLAAVEREVGAPFPDPDPWVEEASRPEPPPEPPALERDSGPEGEPMPAEDVAAVRARATALGEDQRQMLARWAAEGKSAGRPWAGNVLTQRGWNISRAAILCAAELHDADDPDALTRAALTLAMGGMGLHPTWTTGAVLGCLRTSEAAALADLAGRYATNDDAVVASIGRLLVHPPAAGPSTETEQQ